MSGFGPIQLPTLTSICIGSVQGMVSVSPILPFAISFPRDVTSHPIINSCPDLLK